MTRDWIMLTPTVVVPARIPEQPSGLLGPGRLPPTRQPSKDVRGETILAAVVKSTAADRISTQCKLALGLRRGRLQRRLLSLGHQPETGHSSFSTSEWLTSLPRLSLFHDIVAR